jgi:hypothetical protein
MLTSTKKLIAALFFRVLLLFIYANGMIEIPILFVKVNAVALL